MAIPYRKEVVKPDGRKLVAGGPRDQQRRVQEGVDHTTVIEMLRTEIESLRKNMVGGKGEFTGEQVDDEIRKAVTEAIENQKKKSSENVGKLTIALEDKTNKFNELNGELGILKEKIVSLTTTINEKDESLAREIDRSKLLLQQLTTSGDDLVIETDRPQIEPTFIDPLEKTAGERLVPHIKVEDIKSNEKEAMESKVDKLRGLMGKLPNRD